MSLQSEAFEVQGGCGCRAVRYRISVPAEEDRLPHRIPGMKFPQLIICHCDDCRASSAGLAMPAFITQATGVEISVIQKTDSLPAMGKLPDQEREWFPIDHFFSPETQHQRGFLELYNSSPDVYRGFCKRCGTTLIGINFEPPRQPKEKQLIAILLGSIDKADLERYSLKPFRHVWLEDRISWIGKLGNLPKHDLYMYDEFLNEDW